MRQFGAVSGPDSETVRQPTINRAELIYENPYPRVKLGIGRNQNFGIYRHSQDQCQLSNFAHKSPSNAQHALINCTPTGIYRKMSEVGDLLRVLAPDESPPSGSGSRLGTAVIVVCGISPVLQCRLTIRCLCLYCDLYFPVFNMAAIEKLSETNSTAICSQNISDVLTF